jgi:hypothetical protein
MTELNPTNFGVPSKPDKFGQVTGNEHDQSAGLSPSAPEVNALHSADDTDAGPRAHHHTLGTGRNQSSPGNHIHDGITSPKLGALQMDPAGNVTIPAMVLTGAKGGNVALTNLIAMLKNFINFTDGTT